MSFVREELIRPLVVSLSEHATDRRAFTDSRRTVTYGNPLSVSGALAMGLGVARGDRVLIHIGSRVDFAEYRLAVLRSGAVGVPVSVRSTEAELSYYVYVYVYAYDSGASRDARPSTDWRARPSPSTRNGSPWSTWTPICRWAAYGNSWAAALSRSSPSGTAYRTRCGSPRGRRATPGRSTRPGPC